MKHTRKLMALLLALVMVLSLSVTAFAVIGEGTDNNGKITITNTVKDTTYSIYRIFDLESFSDDTPDEPPADGAYSYKVNSAWNGFFADGAKGLEYVTVDGNGYVTWKTGTDVAAFAADALAYAEANNIATAAAAKKATADNQDIVFDTLPLGYYLVDSSLGALCALTTTNPDVTVIEKNANPTLTKEVREGENWGTSNDANIGDTIEFKATITVQGTAKDYVMHDRMDNRLTFGSVVSVTLNGAEVAQDGNYTVENDPALHSGIDDSSTLYDCTFHVVFTEAFCNNLQSGDVIVVVYTAKVGISAVSAVSSDNKVMLNKAHLEYKDNNSTSHQTPDSQTETHTWGIDIFKYHLDGETEKALAGATFTLSKNADGTNPISLSSGGVTSILGPGGAILGRLVIRHEQLADNGAYYRVAVEGEQETVTEITTGDLGALAIVGLDSGTYYLTETKAPNGYNKLAGPIKVVISNDGTVTYYNYDSSKTDHYGETPSGTGEVKVLNQAGVELPTTGGMGTTIFYVVGSILLVGAAVLLVTKKRMGAAK